MAARCILLTGRMRYISARSPGASSASGPDSRQGTLARVHRTRTRASGRKTEMAKARGPDHLCTVRSLYAPHKFMEERANTQSLSSLQALLAGRSKRLHAYSSIEMIGQE